jgi:hypothetical protein
MRAAVTQSWQGWKALTRAIGDFQARLLLTLCYFVLLAPCAAVLTRFADRLDPRSAAAASAWLKRGASHPDIGNARRQY